MKSFLYLTITAFLLEIASAGLLDGVTKILGLSDAVSLDNDVSKPRVARDAAETRIFGGKPARSAQFPYQVGIFSVPYPNSPNGSWCGGMLISNQYVLTAAHCVVNKDTGKIQSSATVYLGATNRANPNENGQRRINVPGRNLIPHENYSNKNPDHDIALVKLPSPVQFNAYIQPISLPTRSFNRLNLEGQIVVSSGWGKQNDNSDDSYDKRLDILQYMRTKVVPGNDCVRTYGANVYNNERQICLNSRGKSVCKGDSGGPHVIEVQGVKVAVGISSYIRREGCTKGMPQALTRISYYLDWIHNHSGIPVYN